MHPGLGPQSCEGSQSDAKLRKPQLRVLLGPDRTAADPSTLCSPASMSYTTLAGSAGLRANAANKELSLSSAVPGTNSVVLLKRARETGSQDTLLGDYLWCSSSAPAGRGARK